jgi:hypothetical protein
MSDSQKIAKRARARGERVSSKTIHNRVVQSRMDKSMSRAMPQQMHGRGNYFTKAMKYVDDRVLKKIPRGAFRAIGKTVAGGVGESVGHAISQLSGRGDYTIQRNSIMQGVDAENGAGNISFAPSGAARIRVQKREFIMNIVSPENPVEFNQTQLRLQATDKVTFPWLAGIAEHFTEWELHGCVFTYESTSSNYAQNMALGTIAMATQYNANELPYSNMEQILSAAYNSRSNPAESMMHGIECDPTLQASEHLFTRRFGASGPPNLYDHGVLSVATEGLPADAGTVLGRIFVNYDIELNIPVLPNGHVFDGDAMVVEQYIGAGWLSSTTEPPMGKVLDLMEVTNKTGLTFSTSAITGANVLGLTNSNGPLARPQLPPEQAATLVAWMSDSTVDVGTQYLSFANAGIYVLELYVSGFTAPTPLPIQVFGATTLTNEVTIEYVNKVTKVYNNAKQQLMRFVFTCTGTDQAVSLNRLWPDETVTFSVLTVCGQTSAMC